MGQIAKNVVLGSVGAAGVFLASAAVTDASSVHTVVQNDTVWALAQKYGVSEQQIESQNHIDPQSHVIYQGQKLTISGEKIPAPTAKTGNYTVQAGDSLWTIAQTAGISVAQLRAANQLGPDAAIIQPGQVLTVAGQQTAAPVVSAPVAQSVQGTPAQPAESVAKEALATQTSAPAVKETAKPVQQQASVQSAAPETPAKAQPAEPTTPATPAQQTVAKPAPSQPAASSAPVQSAPVSQPVAKTVVKSVAQPVAKPQDKAPVSQARPTTQNNTLNDEAAAKEWIAQKESGGSYTAQNHQYYGRYQLTDTYLHGDYSAANQEKVADAYVHSVYGTWSDAKQFWLENNWY